MYEVLVTHKVEKELDRLARIDTRHIIRILQKLDYPFSESLDIKKIVNVVGFYRLRVGKMRVIFEIDKKQKQIWIRKVGYRGGMYRF
jgi:mRNA-degrading endonuclease RelE of RelBE toxin-antitoxin system